MLKQTILVNTNITLPFSANKSGVYTLKFRYANGNGPS